MIHAQKKMKSIKEALEQNLLEPTRLHTMLISSFHRVHADLKIVVPITYEYEAINERLISKNIVSIAHDYKAWHTHMT